MVGAVSRTTLITGGAGYVGALACRELLAAGRRVRVLDRLLHGQEAVADDLEAAGVELIRGDVRDAAARETALQGVDEVVHLAAIVGDPACARDPETAAAVNIEGTRGIIDAAQQAGATRLVFASTCSNYGRVVDPTIPIDETGELRPVSLYAEQKVAMEQLLLGHELGSLRPTCLRFATVYGVAPRMRFDLTVNEFTRDLWADRKLEVFGEQFWRPYVHVSDAARAIRTVLDAPNEITEWWTTFNDPMLNSLITRALDSNLDLNAASSTYDFACRNLPSNSHSTHTPPRSSMTSMKSSSP